MPESGCPIIPLPRKITSCSQLLRRCPISSPGWVSFTKSPHTRAHLGRKPSRVGEHLALGHRASRGGSSQSSTQAREFPIQCSPQASCVRLCYRSPNLSWQRWSPGWPRKGLATHGDRGTPVRATEGERWSPRTTTRLPLGAEQAPSDRRAGQCWADSRPDNQSGAGDRGRGVDMEKRH